MNIEKFKLMEKIKLAYLKNRGDVLSISNDLNLPVEYIQKSISKIKKAEDRNVSVLISNTLMSHIMLGYESRVVNLMEMVKKLEGKEEFLLSICCEAPVRRNVDSAEYGHEDYECLACHQRCEIKKLNEKEVLKIKIELLSQLREEDKSLVELAVKMGYTNNAPPEPQTVNKQNILVINSPEEKRIVDDYSKLAPMEKERLVEKLRAEIVSLDERIREKAETDTQDTL